ncbi:MAG TPA: hypothetical protein DCS93_35005 [Microscillaceae bacterium]|nr:hypothetical protein [Microscillaceae bacterium]
MKKFARISYFLIGSLFPMLIGGLHTFVHFTDLTTPSVKSLLNKSIPIMGENQSLWNTWGMMSFMMGISFIILGLLNLEILHKRREDYPPIQGITVMILYLSCVVYAGITFEAKPQLYGGIFGILLGVICLGITWMGKKATNPSTMF